MNPILDPLGAVRSEIEDASQGGALPADVRIRKLRLWRDDLDDLLGRVDTYIGDLELEREARDPVFREAVMEMREDASIRDLLIERHLAEPGELDALGMLAHEDISKLEEEGLLGAWVSERRLREADLPGDIDWDPVKHPRGRGGEFRDVLGRLIVPKGRRGRALPLPRPARELTGERATAHRAIDVGGDVERAARLLAQGQHVQLSQPREVATLLDRLREMVQEARDKGEKAPAFDLCKVSIKGTSVFCSHSKGVSRVRMPQLKGVPAPGSPADALERDAKGRVNLGDAFREHLLSQGVSVTDKTEKASYLRASQAELDGATVARIANEMETKGRKPNPIFVSKDNYIVDGHHNWAATVGVDLRDNVGGDLNVPVSQIDLPITEVLDQARQFTQEQGIAPREIGGGDLAAPATAEQVSQDLVRARDLGKNEWPQKSEAARRLLGDAADTREKHTRVVRGQGGTRVYTPERQKLHDEIIDTLLRQRREVPRGDGSVELHPDTTGEYLSKPSGRPVALFLAGGSASGKTSALAMGENSDLAPPNAVHIDPDEVKTFLPEYKTLALAGDRSAATSVHEESSDIASRLRNEAVQRGLNMVLDGTGDSAPGKFAGKIRDAAEAGYDPHVFYVNAPVDVAIPRAVARAERTHRWVPEAEIRNQHRNVSARFPEVRALVEDGTIGRIRMYDTGGAEPVVFAEGGGGRFDVRDRGLLDRFQEKATA